MLTIKAQLKALGLSYIGSWKFRWRKYEAALRDLRRAAELNPEKVSTKTLIGMCEYRIANYRGAVDALQRAVKLDPNNATAHAYLASAYEQLGLLSEAIGEITRFIQLQPTFWDRAHWENKAGSLLAAEGRWKEAKYNFERAASLNPCAEYYCNLASALFHEGSHEESQSACAKAKSLTPSSDVVFGISHIYEQIGLSYAARHMFDKAVQTYKLALELRPNNAALHFNMGVAYGEAGDRSNEIAAYRRAIQYDVDDLQTWTNLAIAYSEGNQRDLAVEAWKRVTELSSR